MALFRNVGPDLKDNVVYFFGDAAMCDKMIGQHLRTSHGCLTLSDVTRVELRQEEGSGGGRAIALQTGTGKHVKEMAIVPEEQREFLSWTRHIKVRDEQSALLHVELDGHVFGQIKVPHCNFTLLICRDPVELCHDNFLDREKLPSTVLSIAHRAAKRVVCRETRAPPSGRQPDPPPTPPRLRRKTGVLPGKRLQHRSRWHPHDEQHRRHRLPVCQHGRLQR